MFLIIGWVVVIGCVIGGYALHGGNLKILWQPIEVLVIGGAAVGAFLAGTPMKNLKATVSASLKAFGAGPSFSKEQSLELMALLFEILSKAKKESLMAIEADVEEPANSPIFQKYPKVLADHHLLEFITDYLRMMISGGLAPHEVGDLMDIELETHHAEAHVPVAAVKGVADGLPAFGIVAAVLGVVNTMASVGSPPEVLGGMIAAALVGTFLGIFAAYGFVAPLGNKLEAELAISSKPYECVKATLLASMSGYAPAIAIEFGRKVLYASDRPTFSETEAAMKAAKSK